MRFPVWWEKAFLEERPSIGMSLFRPALAWTVGAHVIPSLLQLEDNYLRAAFKVKNGSFFPAPILALVEASPDWLIRIAAVGFAVSVAAFAAGWRARASCALMTLGCYYFYALNSLHIGTLSYDILLVTLTLVCAAGVTGDAFSLDQLRRADAEGYVRRRPFFAQRLLQVQLTGTFWGTALSKVAGGGNWLTGNPYHALMHYPPEGVVRAFPFRDWLAARPDVCHALGLTVIAFEIAVPLAWWFRRTRVAALALGFAFHLMLWVTLHVPTIFLFLFPAMMLLFIAPEDWLSAIERGRARERKKGRGILLFDGGCGFCSESVKRLKVLDLFDCVECRDFKEESDLAAIHPKLTAERCATEMVWVEPDGRLSGGFAAFRRLCARLVLLWGLVPLVNLPGADRVGSAAYRWIARHRYLFLPRANQCVVGGGGDSAGGGKRSLKT